MASRISSSCVPQLLQVRDLPAAALLHADFADADIAAARARVAQADALVIATPVYQSSFSGVLKTFLDLLPQNALLGKPVLPLAVGGSQSHMLAIDYALRPVLAALGSPHILPGIYAAEAQIKLQGDAGLILDAAIAERVANGIGQLTTTLQQNQIETAPAMLRLA
ncbi:MAG: NADPH-dependent FMN reductase [Burkholderiaceae bacterium]|nr:NADPH-dependent FMN reductase [Burkholderiaceae bacterium]